MVYFREVYYDDDAKEFNVDEFISSDDSGLNDRTVKLQKQGKNVRCGATELFKKREQVPSHEQCIKKGIMMGYKYNPNLKW